MPDYNYYPLPDKSLVRKLERAISEHLLYLRAKHQPYCSGPKLADFDASEIKHWEVPADLKNQIYSRLGNKKGMVYALIYSTSKERSNGFDGHGEVYGFFSIRKPMNCYTLLRASGCHETVVIVNTSQTLPCSTVKLH